jgi:hypothetical protein
MSSAGSSTRSPVLTCATSWCPACSARWASGIPSGCAVRDDTQSDERLRGLTHEQLADRLRWLSWWAPGVFAAVMDYMEFADAVAADTARATA